MFQRSWREGGEERLYIVLASLNVLVKGGAPFQHEVEVNDQATWAVGILQRIDEANETWGSWAGGVCPI